MAEDDSVETKAPRLYSRRDILRLGALSAGGLFLAACGVRTKKPAEPAPPTPDKPLQKDSLKN